MVDLLPGLLASSSNQGTWMACHLHPDLHKFNEVWAHIFNDTRCNPFLARSCWAEVARFLGAATLELDLGIAPAAAARSATLIFPSSRALWSCFIDGQEKVRKTDEKQEGHHKSFVSADDVKGVSFTWWKGSLSNSSVTLWLCQNSYWKLPFIVSFPIKNGDFPWLC